MVYGMPYHISVSPERCIEQENKNIMLVCGLLESSEVVAQKWGEGEISILKML